jgi:hypothetical protein
MERRPAPGEFYRHFKNKYYQIVGIARYSETKEEMVVYQALYGDYGMYVRPLSMFVSEVDHVKYPQVTQKYRFEKVAANQVGETVDTGYAATQEHTVKLEEETFFAASPAQEAVPDGEQPNPILLKFLDQDSYDEKLKYLNAVRQKLTDELIDAMAASLDVTVPEGEIDARYISLRSCLAAHAKYECVRLR